MFGLHDFGIWFVYLLCILSAVACVVYGIINWNKGGNGKDEEKSKKWQEEESDIEENL